jgi:outer membrane protein OmpA-like peptidoglycan-associated protein
MGVGHASTARDAQAQVVSRFEGSVEKGRYTSDFDALLYAETVAREPALQRVEGRILSRVFTKPSGKSNLEVFRSYERELGAAGFTTILAATPSRELEQMVRRIYRPPGLALNTRDYAGVEGRVSRTDLDRISSQTDYYLVAHRAQGERALHVAVVLAKSQDLYLVEELTTEAMEEGTVTLDLEMMRTAIEETGRIAIYDLHFATGSAVIEPSSAAALAVIAEFLSTTSGEFYVVGHTDDTGTLQANLQLSDDRAAAVKGALVEAYGIASSRLEARGVGPLSPVSTNDDAAGKALNRRVEIVQRAGGAP